jgi:hypothetical protein
MKMPKVGCGVDIFESVGVVSFWNGIWNDIWIRLSLRLHGCGGDVFAETWL